MLFLFQQPKPRQTSTNQRFCSQPNLWGYEGLLGVLGGSGLNAPCSTGINPLAAGSPRPRSTYKCSQVHLSLGCFLDRWGRGQATRSLAKTRWVFLGEYHPKYTPWKMLPAGSPTGTWPHDLERNMIDSPNLLGNYGTQPLHLQGCIPPCTY